MYFLEKFFRLSMKDNDLREYNREWDDCHDELDGTQLSILIESEEILCIRYLQQVQNHPWLKEHMAQWTRTPKEEQTYTWLRKAFQRVLGERIAQENAKAWKQKTKHLVVSEAPRQKKSTQGICSIWKKYKRCARTNCPYIHEGLPDTRAKPSSRPCCTNNTSRGRSNTPRSYRSGSSRRSSQRSSRSQRSISGNRLS